MRLASILASTFVLAACGSSTTCAPGSSAPASAATGSAAQAAAPQPDEKAAIAALLGTKPPEWQTERWMSSPPGPARSGCHW